MAIVRTICDGDRLVSAIMNATGAVNQCAFMGYAPNTVSVGRLTCVRLAGGRFYVRFAVEQRPPLLVLADKSRGDGSVAVWAHDPYRKCDFNRLLGRCWTVKPDFCRYNNQGERKWGLN